MGVIGINHLNPKSWIGDISVGKVSLQWCWEEGRKQATLLISSLYPGDPVADFEATFHLENHGLLRPHGKYVGFSDETNFSTQDDQPDDIPATKPPNQDGFSDSEDDGPCGNSGSSSDDMDLKDLLPDSTDKPLDDFYNRGGDWVEVNGQQYLKSSLITQYLKANRLKKVIERTLRVRGLTLDNL